MSDFDTQQTNVKLTEIRHCKALTGKSIFVWDSEIKCFPNGGKLSTFSMINVYM